MSSYSSIAFAEPFRELSFRAVSLSERGYLRLVAAARHRAPLAMPAARHVDEEDGAPGARALANALRERPAEKLDAGAGDGGEQRRGLGARPVNAGGIEPRRRRGQCGVPVEQPAVRDRQ